MNPLVKYLRKRLPKFAKKPIIQFLSKMNSKIIWDRELMTDLMEYYNLSYDETKCMLKLGLRLFCDFWNGLSPRKDNEILSFYKTPLPYDVFSLAYWHMSRGQRRFRKKTMEHCFGDVLDYGGGIGDLSLKIAERGLNVAYAEINGENMKFAKYLFQKRGYDVEVLDVEQDEEKIWNKDYDTIICIDVIEHVLHPETILEKMARHLKDGGRLIVTMLNCPGPTEDAPMHLKMNFDAESYLNQLGLFKSNIYDWLWIKKG